MACCAKWHVHATGLPREAPAPGLLAAAPPRRRRHAGSREGQRERVQFGEREVFVWPRRTRWALRRRRFACGEKGCGFECKIFERRRFGSAPSRSRRRRVVRPLSTPARRCLASAGCVRSPCGAPPARPERPPALPPALPPAPFHVVSHMEGAMALSVMLSGGVLFASWKLLRFPLCYTININYCIFPWLWPNRKTSCIASA